MNKLLFEKELCTEDKSFALRFSWLQRGHRIKYELDAVCPTCQRILTAEEIMQGFTDDSDDFTTGCPDCKARFWSTLICSNASGEIARVTFYCRDQTVLRMGHKIMLRPESFAQKYPEIYHSAVVHFGSLRKAFERIGMTYRHEEQINQFDDKDYQ